MEYSKYAMLGYPNISPLDQEILRFNSSLPTSFISVCRREEEEEVYLL